MTLGLTPALAPVTPSEDSLGTAVVITARRGRKGLWAQGMLAINGAFQRFILQRRVETLEGCLQALVLIIRANTPLTSSCILKMTNFI